MINYLKDIPGLKEDIILGMSSKDITAKYGIPERRARDLRQRINKWSKLNPPDQMTCSESNGIQTIVAISHNQIKSLDELIEFIKPDMKTWEVDSWYCRPYEGFFKSKFTQTATVVQMFSVGAKFKRRADLIIEAADYIQELIDQLKTCPPIYTPTHFPRLPQGDYAVGINISDLHAGKLAWEGETRQNYDVDIAVRSFNNAVDHLLGATNHYDIDEFIIPIGNDLLHSDSPKGQTYAGTQLDIDGRHFRTFDRVTTMVEGLIRRTRDIAKVKVIMVPGNHDTTTIIHLGRLLQAVFRNIDGVEIDSTLWERKYIRYGYNIIGMTHGNSSKRADLPLLLVKEAQKLYSDSRHQEIWTGHLHALKVDEHVGFITRTFPSLSGSDAWHHQHGFVHNGQRAEAIVLAKEGRLEANFFTESKE